MSLEGGSGGTWSPKVPPESEHLLSKPKTGVGRGTPYQPVSIPLTVGVRTQIIGMMGTTHPHLQASEVSALGGGGQKFPRNGGRRGGAKRSLPSSPRFGEGGISPPRPPLLFSVIWGERKFPLPPTPTSLSQRIRRISSKQWETCSHP